MPSVVELARERLTQRLAGDGDPEATPTLWQLVRRLLRDPKDVGAALAVAALVGDCLRDDAIPAASPKEHV